jgi:hypothetical protein
MVLIFGFFFLFVTLIPVGLAYLVFHWLTKKGYRKIGLGILITVIIWTIYSSYTAFYPTDSFFEHEFEYNTGLKFPKSGEILTKDASYPDLHGDYSATALFKTNANDFYQILNAIQLAKRFQADTIPFKFNITNSNKNFKETDFKKCFTSNRHDRDLIFNISFDDKEKLIEIQRDSW